MVLGLLKAATFFLHPRGRVLWNEWHNRVRVEALPAAAAPKARFDPADTANDPDRALFAAPQGLALTTDLPLLSWLSTQAEPLPETTASAPLRGTAPISTNRVVARVWAEWQALPESERASLRTTAAHFFALPAQRHNAALRQRYATQSFDAHRGGIWAQCWAATGRASPHCLRISTPANSPSMHMLRQASPDDLDTLARLAQATPPEHRAALRQSLLALPAAQRSTWLQAQLHQ